MTKEQQLKVYLDELTEKFRPWCRNISVQPKVYEYENCGGIITCECWQVATEVTPRPLAICINEVTSEVGISASVSEGVDGFLIKIHNEPGWQDEEYVCRIPDGFVPMFKAPLEKMPMYRMLNAYFEKYWQEKENEA